MTCRDKEMREIAPGVHMPVIAFGTARIPIDTCESICTEAIRAGWRHIDAAIMYRNQKAVGAAVNNCGVDRTELFITTKILSPPPSFEPEEVYQAVLAGVVELSLEYVDLYLIHVPNLGGPAQRKVVWQALERLYDNGKTRAIGISNYDSGKGHLAEVLSYCRIEPACNQIELHPWCQPASHIKAYQDDGIQLVAFGAIVQGFHMDDLDIQSLAAKYGKDGGQVLLRWSLQKGFIPIVMSTNPARIKSNREVFEFYLLDEEMQQLDAKATGDPPTGNAWEYLLDSE